MLQNKEFLLEESPYLPLFDRRNLIMDKFLGSGAFGEVYEGEATGIKGHIGPTRVAVKVRQLSLYYIRSVISDAVISFFLMIDVEVRLLPILPQ